MSQELKKNLPQY